MTAALAIAQKDASDYLLGRTKVPPFFRSLKNQFYAYTGKALAVTNGNAGQIDIRIDSGFHFLVEGIQILPGVVGAVEGISVLITDTTYSMAWSNKKVPLRDIAGVGDSPKYLAEPQLLRPNATLSVTIYNNQGSTQNFYVTVIGRKVWGLSDDQAAFMNRRQWYQYVFDVPAISGNTTGVTNTLQTLNEADFLCKRILGSQVIKSVLAASAGSGGDQELMLQIRDTTADTNFFSSKTPARLIMGQTYNGATPRPGVAFGLPKPLLIRRNATLSGEFDNNASGAISADTLSFTLEGVRIFDAA